MAVAFRNYKNVAEHFNCPIHLGKLRDPRRLSCEHTFCAECLNGCINSALSSRNDGLFECPVCRAKHHIPPNEMGDWARGFPIDAFCVIQLHTLAQYERSALCEKHIQKFKEYFCFAHRELLCSDCVIEGHTKSPCSCGSLQDSIMEVRLQIKELLGKLRLQEERAKRIMESQVATSHSEELVRKINEVEKMLLKFHKTMKSRLKEAKQKVVEATKISQADKNHLSTVQSLISKTKKHIEEMIHSKIAKNPEGASEILAVWTPLEKETQNFDLSLDDIETRPYCVNIKADEGFLDFISYDKNPLTVTNESEEKMPATPTKEPRAPGTQYPIADSPDQEVDAITKHVRITENTTGAAIPSPMSIRRTISLSSPPTKHGGYQQKLYIDKRPVTQDLPLSPNFPSSNRQSPTRTILKQRTSQAFPKVATGDLVKRDTGRTFNNTDMKLKGIHEVSNFELPCGDILMIDGHLITITETAIQKFSLDYKYLEGLSVRCPWRMCALKDTTNVAVNHNTRFISIVATSPSLNVIYKIETEKPYSGICHMKTAIVEDRFGRVKYHEHFALSHTTDLRVDCIDILTVVYDRNPFSNFQPNQTTKILPNRTKLLIGSDKCSVVRSPNSMAATTSGKRLIIGAESAVVCVKKTGDIIWTRPVAKFVASVCCDRGLVFVCIENERKLMVLDEAGNHLYENIFPLGCNIARPNRVSVERNLMLVREFSESDWKSSVHVFALSFA